MRLFLICSCVCAAGALIPVTAGLAGQPATQTLNPPPPSYYTCKTVGNSTICEGSPPTESFGPIDTALEGPPIVCGSGASSFDVFDAGTDVITARRIYDADGNLVRRVLTDDYTFGEFSNPLTGATVPYRQSDIRTDVFAVPGDLGSATETTTWNIHFHLAGAGAPVFMNTGRTVQAPDGNVEFRAGRLEFFELFVDGDTSCARPALRRPRCLAMKPISYSLQFRGQATPVRSDVARLRLTAPSSALVTSVGPMGVRGRFEDIAGGEAVLDAELSFVEEAFSADQGTIEFGRGNTLRFHGIGGRLTHCPDPHLRHGAVIRQVEGGEGQFAGCEGLITSNFFISDTGEVTENHFGVIFVSEQPAADAPEHLPRDEQRVRR